MRAEKCVGLRSGQGFNRNTASSRILDSQLEGVACRLDHLIRRTLQEGSYDRAWIGYPNPDRLSAIKCFIELLDARMPQMDAEQKAPIERRLALCREIIRRADATCKERGYDAVSSRRFREFIITNNPDKPVHDPVEEIVFGNPFYSAFVPGMGICFSPDISRYYTAINLTYWD